jgi:predicted NBD/HSP70 family sugar kinase
MQLGIDIGGTSVKLACLRGSEVLWTGQSAFYSRPTTAELIAALRQAADGRVGDVAVAGLCVPGLLDRPRHMITLAVNVPGLVGIVLDDLVSQALGKVVGRIEIINDAVATATDVMHALKLRGRLASIAVGTGVGMGILDDGVPLFVEGASPGHIGQMDVAVPGFDVIGPDGGFGSLEGYIGVAALKARYGDDMDATLSRLTIDDPPIAALVKALRIIHAIYRPDHIALVGGVGIRLARLVPEIHRSVCRQLTGIARPGWQLHAGLTDFHAACGAARLAAR